METELLDKISETLHVARSEISAATTLSDLVEDSLDAFELLAVLSDDYQVRIEPRQINELKTVGDLAAYIEANRDTTERGESLKAL